MMEPEPARSSSYLPAPSPTSGADFPMRTLLAVTLLAAAGLLPAQTTATLTNYGAGCYDGKASYS